MNYRIIIAICLMPFVTTVQGVEIQQGQQYAAGTLLESSAAGMALSVPAGWVAGWPQGSGMLLLARSDNQGSIFVYVDEFDTDSARQLMAQPVPLGNGITLTPKSAPVTAGDGTLNADYTVSGASADLHGRISTRIGQHGVGAAFIVIATGNAIDSVRNTAASLVGSVRFSQPAVAQAATGGDDGVTGSWQDYMRGRYVVRYYTGSGYTEEEHIWLCSDGSFYRQTSSGGFGGGASGAFAGKGHGSWKARGSTDSVGELILQYGAGSVSETGTTFGEWTEQGAGGERVTFSLQFSEGYLYLNDRKWFRDGNQRCQ
jgi:hypothetical protein